MRSSDSPLYFKEQIIEDFSAVLVGDGEHGKTEQRGRALAKTTPQVLLIPGVESERMHKIGADQSSLQVVECSGCQIVLQNASRESKLNDGHHRLKIMSGRVCRE